MTTLRILTDTGTRILIEGLADEPIGDYKQGFRDEATKPGGTLSFELASDVWWLFPVARVVAIQAVPDDVGSVDTTTS
jgi:hypothetical protein